MAQDGRGPARPKGKFGALVRLFSKRTTPTDEEFEETEFLNTLDGYELARFAQAHFGSSDAETRRRARAATVAAEQAEIDVLLESTDAVPVEQQPEAPAAPAPTAQHREHTAPPRAQQPSEEDQVELAVRYLEKLRERGLSVEILAEALIIIESREARQRQGDEG
jgi:hypothetical protein